MKPLLKKLRNSKLLRNKYMIALILFAVWISFFDQNNLVQHRRNKQRLKALKEQRAFYREKIEADNLKMEELRSGVDNLEKYAREQFNMTRPDEDLFLVVEE
ncbi:MAG TPA: septum formation initiator family protein [Prolixibacteraceae bacterium]|nr:septum formation initiator family protein [Bacteroidales bacterium]HNQ36687.1 septum formation initiator family protein [Prolixibacteraceae bacterium]HOY50127.1 septum formation initiator family protein [Prolixibacteraceae bacterium]HPJ78166.1 septum formation initiator family protein [Prolixibacteraceae bacterium]HRV89887.1 septum formation initiator family protein [Prolixibacteraceae bacterium]